MCLRKTDDRSSRTPLQSSDSLVIERIYIVARRGFAAPITVGQRGSVRVPPRCKLTAHQRVPHSQLSLQQSLLTCSSAQDQYQRTLLCRIRAQGCVHHSEVLPSSSPREVDRSLNFEINNPCGPPSCLVLYYTLLLLPDRCRFRRWLRRRRRRRRGAGGRRAAINQQHYVRARKR